MPSQGTAHPNEADDAVRTNNEIFNITILQINFERSPLERVVARQVHLNSELSCAWHSNRDVIVNNKSTAKSKPNQAE